MKTYLHLKKLALMSLLLVNNILVFGQVDALTIHPHDRFPYNEARSNYQAWQSTTLVPVYTVNEIDNKVNQLNSSLIVITQNQVQYIKDNTSSTIALEQKIQQTEDRFNDLVKKSVDEIPQRLLSEEAKNILKEAVITELRREVEALRKEMQLQINEIKQGRQ